MESMVQAQLDKGPFETPAKRAKKETEKKSTKKQKKKAKQADAKQKPKISASFAAPRPAKSSAVDADGFMTHVGLGLPSELWPQEDRKGKYSYTVSDPVSGAAVEILLRARAFYVKRSEQMPARRHVVWGSLGPAAVWNTLRQAIGWSEAISPESESHSDAADD
jgi:hypothetical protein